MNPNYDDIDLDRLKLIKDNIHAVASTKYYHDAVLARINQENRKYADLRQVINTYETTGSADFAKMNDALYKMYDPYFSSTFGAYGTDAWKQNMVDYFHNKDGRVNEQHVSEFLQVWTELNKAFDWLPSTKKALLAPYINKDLIASILPEGFTLPEVGIAGGAEGAYAYDKANNKYIRQAYINAYGQEDLAWFRVNGDGSIADKPYFNTDLVSEVGGSSVPKIPFSGKVFDPLKGAKTQVNMPYAWDNGRMVPNFDYGGTLQGLPTVKSLSDRSLSLPGLNLPDVDTTAYRPSTIINTDKPVAQGNQILADNVVGSQVFNLYFQESPTSDINTLQGLLAEAVSAGVGEAIDRIN